MKFKDTFKYKNEMYQVTWPWKEKNPELPAKQRARIVAIKIKCS